MESNRRTLGASLRGAPWRKNARGGDQEVVRLSQKAKPGDRVYFDPGPGVRVSGVLKDWEAEGLAAVEVDIEDRGIPQVPGFSRVETIMKVPVKVER